MENELIRLKFLGWGCKSYGAIEGFSMIVVGQLVGIIFPIGSKLFFWPS